MFLGALRHKEEAIKVLERRAKAYEVEIANVDTKLRQVPPDLPRLFTIEEEYGQAMRRAELDWIRRTIAELQDGSLEWPDLLEHQQPMG
jgi:phosphopantetheine adenylyltransferase